MQIFGSQNVKIKNITSIQSNYCLYLTHFPEYMYMCRWKCSKAKAKYFVSLTKDNLRY